MTVALAETCDFAVWDVDGTLTADLRADVRNARQRVGKQLTVSLGDWQSQRVVVARPNRLTTAALPTISQALNAITLAHDPDWIVVIGPGAACITQAGRGELVRHTGIGSAYKTESLAVGHLVQGTVEVDRRTDTDSGPLVATEWLNAASRATRAVSAPVELLAVVTRLTRLGQPVVPPSAKPTTVARRLGKMLGGVLRPSVSPARAEPSVDTTGVVTAIAALAAGRERRP